MYRNATPVLVTLVSFWHFAVVRGQTLTPSIAFTTVCVVAWWGGVYVLTALLC